MGAAEDNIELIINNAIQVADGYTSQSERYAGFGVSMATGGQPTVINPYPWTEEVTAVEPPVATVDSATTIYETERDELIALLSNELADFLGTYYPLVNDAYDDATSWLVNTITNGGTGIPQAIEDQIWQRGRDRLITESRRTSAQTVSGFTAKGYMVPAGVLTKTLKEIELAQHGAMGEMSTSIATKQAEIEIENIKFAIKEALNARLAGIGAATDYIRAIAVAPQIATKLADIDPAAQARMISATSDLYRARLSRDQLVMNTEVAKMGNFQSDQKLYYLQHKLLTYLVKAHKPH